VQTHRNKPLNKRFDLATVAAGRFEGVELILNGQTRLAKGSARLCKPGLQAKLLLAVVPALVCFFGAVQ